MDEKICIKSLLPSELADVLTDMNEPRYRSKQIFKWLSQGVTDFDGMSDISKVLREKLRETCVITHPKIIVKQESKLDGTIKYLFELEDGNCIETVLMQYEHGNSICLSTQAGCKMGCVFCASFEKGATRNLRAAEILDQIIFAQIDSGRKVSNIVLMGTGEPLDNYDNVLDFLKIVSHEDGINIGMRHISLSTCGIVPRIEQLAQLKLQLTLSISLHAPFNDIRDKLMPINKKYPLEQLIPACKRYFKITGRRISFEYAMIENMTDTERCNAGLVNMLHSFPCHVNLIPLNHVEGSPLNPTKKPALRKFQNDLIQKGINATVRRSLGSDIAASCGQLKKRAITEEIIQG